MTARTAARQTPIWTETHEPTGRVQRLLGPLYPTGIFWFALCSWSMRWLPYALTRFLFWFVALASCLLLRRVRRGITANLNVVMGPTGFLGRELRIYRTLWMFALVTLDRYSMFHHRDRLAIEIEGKEHWHAAMAHDHGCAVVSGHLGNWEVASLVPMTVRKCIHVVREREIDPRTQAFVDDLYGIHEGSLFRMHYADEDATLGPTLLMALRRGDLVGLSADQPRTGQGYVEAEMFGRPTPLPHGPAALARAAEAVILPVFGIRTGALRYRMIVGEPFCVARTGDRQQDVATATQRIADRLQEVITASPHSWFCWYPRWPDGR